MGCLVAGESSLQKLFIIELTKNQTQVETRISAYEVVWPGERCWGWGGAGGCSVQIQ